VHHQQEDTGSRYADEGTILHEIAAEVLISGIDPKKKKGQVIKSGETSIPITSEMIDVITEYTDIVNQFKSEGKLKVESEVSLQAYGPDFADIHGTADAIIDAPFDTLTIIDLKTGQGVSVPADSPQIKLYALMAAGKRLLSYETIRTVISQPRDKYGDCYKEAIWEPGELLGWWKMKVLPAIRDGRSPQPSYGPSETACRWCSYKGKCPAQTEKALKDIRADWSGLSELSDPNQLSAERISEVLDSEEFIKQWLESIRALAMGKLFKGENIPDWKLVRGNRMKFWKPEIDVPHILNKELKFRKKDIYTEKLKSPRAILELAGKDEKKQKRIAELFAKTEGKPTLAKASDKRDPIAPRTGENDFTDFINETQSEKTLL